MRVTLWLCAALLAGLAAGQASRAYIREDKTNLVLASAVCVALGVRCNHIHVVKE